MSPVRQDLRAVFDAVARAVRRDAMLATIAAVALLLPAAMLVAWVLAGSPRWSGPGPWPLLLDLVALSVAVAAGVVGWRRWLSDASEERVGAAVEKARGLPLGSLRGVLELTRHVPAGTSQALARSAEARMLAQLGGARREELSGEAGRRARARMLRAGGSFFALAAIALLTGLASPQRSRAAWKPLLRPVSALIPPPLPGIVVQPGNARVRRGASLPVRITAPGRAHVTLAWQVRGDVRRSRDVALEDARGESELTGIDAPTRYWVNAPDGAHSDTFTVVPREALLIAGLSYELNYPRYLDRESERFDGELPALDIPEGTSIVIRGRATRPLSDVTLLRGDSGSTRLVVAGRTFSGRWTPAVSGRYEWHVRGSDGADAEVLPAALELNVVPDLPPDVQVTYPGVDTIMATDMRQPVAAAAGDDYGVRAAELVSWRVSALGRREEAVSQPVAVEGEAQRLLLQTMLDASQRGMLPGDTLFYFVRVTDNSPRAQTARSATYRLRLPGAEELRRQVETDVGEATRQAEEAAGAAEKLQRETRDLQRRGGVGQSQPSGGSTRAGRNGETSQPRSGKALDYAQAQEAQRILEQQESLVKQAESLREKTESLRKAAEQAGLTDPELQKRLEELTKLYDQLLTPELRAKLEALKKALADLDPEQVNQALEQLANSQEQFRQNLEESLELLRRAAVEQQTNSLAQSAKELATQQRSLSDQLEQTPSPADRAQQQRDLAARADSLRQAMADLQQRLEAQHEDAAAQQTTAASAKAARAQQSMQQAAQSASGQRGQEAAQQGRQAAAQLDSVAQSLDTQRQQMAQRWRQETQQAVDQAANDALALAQRQNALLQQMQQSTDGSMSRPSLAKPPENGSDRSKGATSLPQPSPKAGKEGGQQQGGQPGQQRGGQTGQQQGGKGQQGQGQQPEQGQPGERQGGGQPGQGGEAGSPPGDYDSIRAEQAALQEGLEQLGRNLSEAGRRSAMVNRDVTAALSRAALGMRRTLDAMEQGRSSGRMPVPEATQTLDALNRLALSLLSNQQQIAQSESGTGMQQALEQLAELARQQGSLNGQTSSLLPLQLAPGAMRNSVQRLGQQQKDIADQLDSMNRQGKNDGVLGDLGGMQKEADQLARDLAGGRLSPEVLQRQEQLFHRLLDSGRTLERDEYSQERVSRGPGDTPLLRPDAIDPSKIGDGIRYPVPTPEQLRALPPAYRRLILEYFERLNRGARP